MYLFFIRMLSFILMLLYFPNFFVIIFLERMVEMIKKINQYINLSIVLSILFMIVGLLLIVWPKASLDTFAYVIGTIMIIYGIYSFIDSFSINPALCLFQMTNSILSFLLGICVFLNPSIFESILPIALGIFFIISGAFSSRISFIIKDIDNSYILSLFTSILMVICGVVLIINPGNTALVITTLIGIILIVYSVSAIVDMFVFKSRVKEIDKYFSKLLK